MDLVDKRVVVPGSLNLYDLAELKPGDGIQLKHSGNSSCKPFTKYGILTQVQWSESTVKYDQINPASPHDKDNYTKALHYFSDLGLMPYSNGKWNAAWSLHRYTIPTPKVTIKFFGQEVTLAPPLYSAQKNGIPPKECKHRHVYLRSGTYHVCLRTNTNSDPIFIFADQNNGDNTYCLGDNLYLTNFTLVGVLPDNAS